MALAAGTCSYVNAFLEVLRKLMAFLEHGTPGRRIPAATKVAACDVKAAVLKDVDGLTHREIGRELGVPPPEDELGKGDHPPSARWSDVAAGCWRRHSALRADARPISHEHRHKFERLHEEAEERRAGAVGACPEMDRY